MRAICSSCGSSPSPSVFRLLPDFFSSSPFLLAASCCHVAACCCRNVLWRVVNLKRLQISVQAHIKYTHTHAHTQAHSRLSYLGRALASARLSTHTHAETCTCMIDKYIDRDSSTRFYIQTEGMRRVWRVWQLHN